MARILMTGCDSGGANEDPGGNNGGGETNSAPPASASADQTTVDVGTQVTLDASGSSDPDNDALSYSWSLSAPSGSSAQLSDDTAEQPTFTPDAAGDYTATVTVDDGNGGTDDASVTVTAETQDVVEVNSDITSNTTWEAGPTYRVTTTIGIQNNATLTIEAGTQVEFQSGAGLFVDGNGSALVANGTSSEGIVMTGTQQQDGFWRGVAFYSNNAQNAMSYVEVAYGGGGTWSISGSDEGANVLLEEGARLSLSNSTVRNSGSWGIWLNGNNTFDDSGTTYQSNASGDVGQR